MPAVPRPKEKPKPVILTARIEEILKTIHLYRYMTALDVARLLYAPASITYVRGLLASLSGGEDLAICAQPLKKVKVSVH